MIDLKNLENIKQLIISEVEQPQNQERMAHEWDAWQIYSGDLKRYVFNEIQRTYPKTYNSFTISEINHSKKIIDKLSMAYNDGVIRELDSDNETEEYRRIMEKNHANLAYMFFDKYKNLHRYAGMQVIYKNKKDETGLNDLDIMLRPIGPYQFNRVVDQFGKTKLVILGLVKREYRYTSDQSDGTETLIQDTASDKTTKRYALYTDDQYCVVRVTRRHGKYEIQYEIDESNPDMVNPLGVIPFVFWQDGHVATVPITNAVTDQTITANELMSLVITGAAHQTFGQLIVSHDEKVQIPDELTNSLFTYMRLPQKEGRPASTANYISPSPNLDAMLDVYNELVQSIYSENNIVLGESDGSKDYTSGLDRMLSQADTRQVIEQNQKIYKMVEDGVYQVIKRIYEVANNNLFKTEKLNVHYPMPKPYMDDEQMLKIIREKIELGMIEEHEKFIIENPNLSDDAAKEKLQRINDQMADRLRGIIESRENSDNQE